MIRAIRREGKQMEVDSDFFKRLRKFSIYKDLPDERFGPASTCYCVYTLQMVEAEAQAWYKQMEWSRKQEDRNQFRKSIYRKERKWE